MDQKIGEWVNYIPKNINTIELTDFESSNIRISKYTNVIETINNTKQKVSLIL